MSRTNRVLGRRNETVTSAFDVDEVNGAATTITGPDFVESSAEETEPSAEDDRESDPS